MKLSFLFIVMFFISSCAIVQDIKDGKPFSKNETVNESGEKTRIVVSGIIQDSITKKEYSFSYSKIYSIDRSKEKEGLAPDLFIVVKSDVEEYLDALFDKSSWLYIGKPRVEKNLGQSEMSQVALVLPRNASNGPNLKESITRADINKSRFSVSIVDRTKNKQAGPSDFKFMRIEKNSLGKTEGSYVSYFDMKKDIDARIKNEMLDPQVAQDEYLKIPKNGGVVFSIYRSSIESVSSKNFTLLVKRNGAELLRLQDPSIKTEYSKYERAFQIRFSYTIPEYAGKGDVFEFYIIDSISNGRDGYKLKLNR